MIARISLLILFLFAMGACSPRPAKVDNQDGVVTSIGPVTAEDGTWVVQFSIFDFEGDPVDVIAEIAGGEDPWMALEPCVDAAAPCLKQSLRAVSTRADGRDAQHQVVIDAGGLALSKTRLRFYAHKNQSDAVVWPNP